MLELFSVVACREAADDAPYSAVPPGAPRAAPRPTRRRPSRKRKPELPRERLLDRGPAAVSDKELIAVLLGSGVPGRNVFEVAEKLYDRLGSLRGLLDASPDDFRGHRGVGPARTALLVAVTELARRALTEKARERPIVDSPGAVEDYLRLKIGTRPYEVFVSLYLDARHRLISCEEITRGSLTRMAVYPREIARGALMTNAAALIVAHNHPSGAVRPSAEDRRLTRALRDTLTLIDVQLLDHVVVGVSDTFSFARAGWL